MTHEEVKTWVDVNFQNKLREFGLGWWRVDVLYEDTGDSFANCTSFPEYERSTIRINTRLFADQDENKLIDTIEHEIFHIVHSPFEELQALASKILHSDHHNAINHQACLSAERTVRNLERMAKALRNPEPST